MKRLIRVLGGIAVIVALMFIGGIAFFWFSVYMLPTFTPNRERLEQYLGSSLPSDATDIQIRIDEGFRDNLFIARFTVPEDSYASFIASVCTSPDQIVAAELNTNLGVGGVDYPDWWFTDLSTIELSGRCRVDIFVDQQESGAMIIYMIGF